MMLRKSSVCVDGGGVMWVVQKGDGVQPGIYVLVLRSI